MSSPTFLPPPAPYGWGPARPRSSGARIHAGIALGVIGIVGCFGSTIAFFMVAFMGDGCGFADSPPICRAGGAVWGLMLEPALATAAACVLAVVGLVRSNAPRAHVWPAAAWAVWIGGGALWVLLLAWLGVS